MKEITNQADFQAIIAAGKPVLLDFYADWCGPCRTLLPTVESLAEKHKEHFNIVKVNVDKNSSLAQEFNVRSIPALFFIKDGKIQERLVGLQTATTLDNKIKAYAGVNA